MSKPMTPSQHIYWILTARGCKVDKTRHSPTTSRQRPGTFVYYTSRHGVPQTGFISDHGYHTGRRALDIPEVENEMRDVENLIKIEQGR